MKNLAVSSETLFCMALGLHPLQESFGLFYKRIPSLRIRLHIRLRLTSVFPVEN